LLTSIIAKKNRANTGCSSSSTLTVDGSAGNSASSNHKPALRIEGSFAAGAASFLDARFLARLLATLAAYDPAYEGDDYKSSSTSGGGGEWKGSDAL
jgi:hypothetical protein